MTPQLFLTAPADKTKVATVGIIAAAFSGGQPKSGVDQAPQLIVEAGIVDQLKSLNWEVEFGGKYETFAHLKPAEDKTNGVMKNPRFVGNVCKEVAQQVEQLEDAGKLALTIGGDHSLGMGTVCGTSKSWKKRGKDICVLWIDAHADINTPETTSTGNIHGMPVCWLLGLTQTKVPGFEWIEEDMPHLNPSHIAYIGLRDVDAGEKEILKKHNIKAYSMHDVDKYGIYHVIQMALDHINPHRDLPIHLSFDVDALDPSVAPATGTPVRGGLTFREGHFICEIVHETGLMVAVDIMEVNPTLGDETQKNQTVQIGCSLIRCALGETLL